LHQRQVQTIPTRHDIHQQVPLRRRQHTTKRTIPSQPIPPPPLKIRPICLHQRRHLHPQPIQPPPPTHPHPPPPPPYTTPPPPPTPTPRPPTPLTPTRPPTPPPTRWPPRRPARMPAPRMFQLPPRCAIRGRVDPPHRGIQIRVEHTNPHAPVKQPPPAHTR